MAGILLLWGAAEFWQHKRKRRQGQGLAHSQWCLDFWMTSSELVLWQNIEGHCVGKVLLVSFLKAFVCTRWWWWWWWQHHKLEWLVSGLIWWNSCLGNRIFIIRNYYNFDLNFFFLNVSFRLILAKDQLNSNYIPLTVTNSGDNHIRLLQEKQHTYFYKVMRPWKIWIICSDWILGSAYMTLQMLVCHSTFVAIIPFYLSSRISQ